jgi:hypothetical protein
MAGSSTPSSTEELPRSRPSYSGTRPLHCFLSPTADRVQPYPTLCIAGNYSKSLWPVFTLAKFRVKTPVIMLATVTRNSHHCTCLDHLGWHNTDRIISIYVMLPRQGVTVTCCCRCRWHYCANFRQCKWSINEKKSFIALMQSSFAQQLAIKLNSSLD